MYLKFLTTEPKNSLFFHIHSFSQVIKKISVWFFNFCGEQLVCSYASLEVVFYIVSS